MIWNEWVKLMKWETKKTLATKGLVKYKSRRYLAIESIISNVLSYLMIRYLMITT